MMLLQVGLYPCVVRRVLQPPGGGSSNLFGGYEEDSAPSRRPNKMASKVFAPPEQPQSAPRRSNPPGQTSLLGMMDVQRRDVSVQGVKTVTIMWRIQYKHIHCSLCLNVHHLQILWSMWYMKVQSTVDMSHPHCPICHFFSLWHQWIAATVVCAQYNTNLLKICILHDVEVLRIDVLPQCHKSAGPLKRNVSAELNALLGDILCRWEE